MLNPVVLEEILLNRKDRHYVNYNVMVEFVHHREKMKQININLTKNGIPQAMLYIHTFAVEPCDHVICRVSVSLKKL